MLIDKTWNDLLPDDWMILARTWLAGDETASLKVVRMNFTAAPEHQWRFILVAVQLATTQDELDHIAAGPIEHLLGWHGDKFIDRVEQQVAADEKFRCALSNVRRYLMKDAVWSRVLALKARKA